MNAITFTWQGVDFTVRPSTIRSAMAFDLLFYALLETKAGEGDPLADMQRWYFAHAVAQTAISGALDGWAPPADYRDSHAIRASFEAWQVLPEDLYHLWIPALNQVNAPLVAAEYAPEFAPEPDEKKD